MMARLYVRMYAKNDPITLCASRNNSHYLSNQQKMRNTTVK